MEYCIYPGGIVKYQKKMPASICALVEYLNQLAKEFNEVSISYKEWSIPKKTGGLRHLSSPEPPTKHAQQTLLNAIKGANLPTQACAYAYVPNRSIVDATRKHKNSNWFLKIDLKNFFPNCTPQFIEEELSHITPFNHLPLETKRAITRLITYKGGLPQGAPTSPVFSNLVMTRFDYKLQSYTYSHNLIYTRYADDLLISSVEPFNKDKVVNVISAILEDINAPFHVNHKKTRYGNCKGRNWNLGLMINKDHDVTIGYRKKQQLKPMIHNAVTKGCSPSEAHRILGIISYYKMVEPVYMARRLNSLSKKYNLSIVKYLKDIIQQP